MFRFFAATLLFLLSAQAAPLAAQIFPENETGAGGEADDAGKAGSSAAGKADPPPKRPPPRNAGGDKQKFLERYEELLQEWATGESALAEQKKLFEAVLDDQPADIAAWYRGLALLRLGFYSEAEEVFRKEVKPRKRRASEGTENQRAIYRQISAGRGFYLRARAAVMTCWDSPATEEELEAQWEKASRKIDEVLADFADSGKHMDADHLSRARDDIEELRTTGKEQWRTRMEAERAVRESPDKLESWSALIKAVGPSVENRGERLTAPYLIQRAALTVIAESFQNIAPVQNGTVDAGIALSFASCLQFQAGRDHLQVRDYHNDEAPDKFQSTRVQIDYAETLYANTRD